VDHLQSIFTVSQRRACGLVDMHRSSYHYRPQTDRDAPLATALRALAAKRRRWGYRRLLLLLRREGWMDNHKRVYRVYRQLELQVRHRRKRRTTAWSAADACPQCQRTLVDGLHVRSTG